MDDHRDGIGGNDLKLGAAGVRGASVISQNLALLATVFRRLARSRGRRRRVKLAFGLDWAGSHLLRCHRAKNEPNPTRLSRKVTKMRPELIPEGGWRQGSLGGEGHDLRLLEQIQRLEAGQGDMFWLW